MKSLIKFIRNLFKDDGIRYCRGSMWIDDKFFEERLKKMTEAQSDGFKDQKMIGLNDLHPPQS